MNWKYKAFTLIELLVVIAVIAVLMGILMPALKKAKEQAQSIVCQGNLKGFSLATSMYVQDNDDKYLHSDKVYFDTLERLPGETVSGRWNRPHMDRWCNRQVNLKYRPEFGSTFFRYLVDVKSLICPTFKRLAQAKGGRISEDVTWWGTEDESVYDPWHNYTMNAFLGPHRDAALVKQTQVKRPAEVFVFADEGPYTVRNINKHGINDTSLWVIRPAAEAERIVKQLGNKNNVKPGLDTTFGQPLLDIIAGFHNAPSGDVTSGKGNCTFADGHVAPVSRDDSFCVAWPK